MLQSVGRIQSVNMSIAIAAKQDFSDPKASDDTDNPFDAVRPTNDRQQSVTYEDGARFT